MPARDRGRQPGWTEVWIPANPNIIDKRTVDGVTIQRTVPEDHTEDVIIELKVGNRCAVMHLGQAIGLALALERFLPDRNEWVRYRAKKARRDAAEK